jgi:hypothetical protein
MPNASQMPNAGRIDPAYHLLTQQQSDALTLSWQQRLTGLAAAAHLATP